MATMDYPLWDIITSVLEWDVDAGGAYQLYEAAPWRIITCIIPDVPGVDADVPGVDFVDDWGPGHNFW